MKIVVTGGAGFVGRHVAAAVLEAGHECSVLDVSPIPQELAAAGVHWKAGSLTSIGELRAALREADAVLHLAGVGDVYLAAEKPWLAAELNVVGSANLAEACLAEGVGRVVYASTWEVYGHPHYEPLDEKHPTNPDHPYNVTKLGGEQILLTGDLPSPSNPPSGCRFHTRCPWRQETRCDDERPQLRVVAIDGVVEGHRVACHWAEQIESGELQPHAVKAIAIDPSASDTLGGDLMGPASLTEAL